MREPSYKARKLAKLLEPLLAPLWPQFKVTIPPDEIYPATGWYRSSKQADCLRWEANIHWDGKPMATVVSWDTMTECCRNGIELRRKKGDFNPHRVVGDYEVNARSNRRGGPARP